MMAVKRTLSYQGRKDAERLIARGDPESVIYELCADIEGYCEIIGKLQAELKARTPNGQRDEDGIWHPREAEPLVMSDPHEFIQDMRQDGLA